MDCKQLLRTSNYFYIEFEEIITYHSIDIYSVFVIILTGKYIN